MTESFAHIMKEAVLETLWPKRCACCESYGELLCGECKLNLDYIDACKACPVCGSAFGKVQCCDCSQTMLAPLGLTRPPFDACVSAVNLDEDSGRMVTLYKDAGDRGLAEVMAAIMAAITPPAWVSPASAVTYVPASERAIRRRGWDHAEALALAYGRALGMPVVRLFARPRTLDQRNLSRKERFHNMERALQLKSGAAVPCAVIIVDDVFTTGSTLFAATRRLRATRGDVRVDCITFART